MKYIFGPVPSRRLGRSLGIDPLPLKTCNWNCVYCQLGRTAPLTSERRDVVPPQEILAEFRAFMKDADPNTIDWVSIAGSGEPLLVAGLGPLIKGIKDMTPLPLALITNGSLFCRPEVRRDVLLADAILPSVDAGSAEVFRRINRPHRGVTYEQFIQGLIDLRREYRGRLWPEVMIVAGINDSPQALRDIAAALKRIGPDKIHINSPVRPPSESWVKTVDEKTLRMAQEILGDRAEIITDAEGEVALKSHHDIEEAITGMVTRHPVSDKTLRAMLTAWDEGRVQATLDSLKQSGRLILVERQGERFWCSAASRFV